MKITSEGSYGWQIRVSTTAKNPSLFKFVANRVDSKPQASLVKDIALLVRWFNRGISSFSKISIIFWSSYELASGKLAKRQASQWLNNL